MKFSKLTSLSKPVHLLYWVFYRVQTWFSKNSKIIDRGWNLLEPCLSEYEFRCHVLFLVNVVFFFLTIDEIVYIICLYIFNLENLCPDNARIWQNIIWLVCFYLCFRDSKLGGWIFPIVTT